MSSAKKLRVSYQGEPGAYSEAAAIEIVGNGHEFRGLESWRKNANDPQNFVYITIDGIKIQDKFPCKCISKSVSKC